MLIHLSDAENIGNRHELRVAVDVHVRRISRYLGLTDPAAKTITDTVRQEIQDAWDRDIRDGGSFCPVWPLVNTAGSSGSCALGDWQVWLQGYLREGRREDADC